MGLHVYTTYHSDLFLRFFGSLPWVLHHDRWVLSHRQRTTRSVKDWARRSPWTRGLGRRVPGARCHTRCTKMLCQSPNSIKMWGVPIPATSWPSLSQVISSVPSSDVFKVCRSPHCGCPLQTTFAWNHYLPTQCVPWTYSTDSFGHTQLRWRIVAAIGNSI